MLALLLLPLALYSAQKEPSMQLSESVKQYELPVLPSYSYGMAVTGGDGDIFVTGGMAEAATLNPADSFTPLAQLYRLKENAVDWETFPFPTPRAYTAAVLDDQDKLYVIGGLSKNEITNKAAIYHITKDTVNTTDLPPLPKPVAFAKSVIFNHTIWVIGGLKSRYPLELNDQIYTLSLNNPERGWTSTESPIPARLLPDVTTHLNSILVAGGWTPNSEIPAKWTARRDIWRYRTEGSRSGNAWKEQTPAPCGLGDASSATVGQSHLVFVNIPAKTEVDQFAKITDIHRPNRPVALAYHIITDSWFELGTQTSLVNHSAITNWTVLERTGFKTMKKSVPVILNFGSVDTQATTSEYWVSVSQNKLGLFDYGLMAIYGCAMIGIGIYYARKEKNSEDFFVGGRKIPWWAAAISAQATGASAITMMAIPALVYKESIVYFGANLFLGIIPAVFSAIFLIPIIRRLNLVSIYEYLEARFGNTLRLTGASLYVISQIAGRMGVVVLLPALALSSVSGINVYVCIVSTGLIAMFYTTLGGISSVIWSDVVQFGIMLGGAILCVFLILIKIEGGFSTFIDVSTDYNKWQLFNFSFDFTLPIFWILLLMAPVTAFTSISDQAFIQRISSIKDVKGAQKATIWNYLWALPLQCSMWLVGIALFVFYKHYPLELDPTKATDTVFPQFISGQIPVGLSGIIVIGILAAAMSSLDSSMNSVSTVVITDFYRYFKKNPTEKDCLRMARIMTVTTGILGIGSAILIASLDLASGQEVFSRIMSLVIGAFPALFTLALLTRKANSIGAIASLFGGSLAVYSAQTYTSVNWLLLPVIAFTSAIAIGYVVSVLTGGSRKDLTGLTVWTISPDSK